MNRSAGSFLTLAVLISVAANPAFRSSAPPRETAQKVTAAARDAAGRHNSASRRKNGCVVDPDTYEGSLYEAVRVSFSRVDSSVTSQLCPETVRVEEGTRVAFAFVPDPIHTHLALQFDRQIDAIQQAVQDSGWTFERALMPWETKEHAESSDLSLRLKADKYQQKMEDQPGLLIFRDHPHKLLVFVVGESPTAGIRKPQAANALAMVGKLWHGRHLPETLAVMGPTFSGSLASVSDLLNTKCAKESKSALCTAKRVLLVSGTVTGTEPVDRFREKIEDPHRPAVPQVLFASMQESDKNAIRRFLHYAMNHGYCPEQIALLSEDETAYGSHSPTKQSEKQAAQGANDNNRDYGCSPTYINDDVLDRAEGQMMKLYFPREISQLRAAYQQNGDATAADKAPRTTLPSDMTTTGEDDDTVRQYSQKQLPLSQEAVLLGIVGELRKHDVHIVLVSASDPLDQLFLSRYLRMAYPAGQIVTTGADLLFSREMDSRLHGILALTTYSLVAGADHEDGNEKHNDRVFPSSDSVGAYNAMKLLLVAADPQNQTENAPKTEYVPNLAHLPRDPELFQYALPQDLVSTSDGYPSSRQQELKALNCVPPVHLTVLGNDGYWNVAVLAPRKAESSKNSGAGLADEQPCVENAHSRLDGIHGGWATTLPFVGWESVGGTKATIKQPDKIGLLPTGWGLLVLAGMAISLGYVYLCWTASILASSEAVAHLAPPRSDSRAILFAATTYLHLLLLGTLYWPYKFINEPHAWQEASVVACIAVVLILGILDLRRRGSGRLAVTFAAASVATCGILVYPWKGESLHYFALRSVHLTSGVSPILPIFMLLLAALWGTWYALSGSCLADARRPALPILPKKDSPLRTNLERFRSVMDIDQKRLLSLLKANHIDWTTTVFAAGLMLALAWCGGNFPKLRLVYSVERNGYEYVLAALIACVVIGLVYIVVRIQKTWIELRRLLLSLDSLPVRRIFASLKELGFAWSPIWQMGAANLSESRRLLSRQIEALMDAMRLGVPGIAETEAAFNDQMESMRHAYQQATDVDHAWNVLQGTPTPVAARLKHVFLLPVRWVRELSSRVRIENKLLNEYQGFQTGMGEAAACALAFSAEHWTTQKSNGTGGAANKLPDDPGEVELEEESGNGGLVTATIRIRKVLATRTHATQEQIGACEQFLALVYATFILAVVVRIRTLVMAVGGMYVFFLLALTAYPFQPQVAIRMSLVAMLVLVAGAVATVYAQMHRDATLSSITNTKAGELGMDFWIRIASFIAVPAFSLIASQFPTIGGTLNSWLQPAMAALK